VPLPYCGSRCFPFIERIYADGRYQGPKMARAVAKTGACGWRSSSAAMSIALDREASTGFQRPGMLRRWADATASNPTGYGSLGRLDRLYQWRSCSSESPSSEFAGRISDGVKITPLPFSSGIGALVHPDVTALEGLHERLGHAVALGSFGRGEAGFEVERQGDRIVLWAAKGLCWIGPRLPPENQKIRIVDALNEMLRQSLLIALPRIMNTNGPHPKGDFRMIRKLAILMAVVAWSSWLGTELAARYRPELFGLAAGPNSQRLITVTPGRGV
jgi:hypothetical protein